MRLLHCYKAINVIRHKIMLNNNNIYITPLNPLTQTDSLADVDHIIRVFLMFGIYVPSLEIIFGDLPVKMTSTNEFVPVMKQNIPVIVADCQKQRIQNMQWLKSLNTQRLLHGR